MRLDLAFMEKHLQRGIDEFDSAPLAAQLLRRLATESPDLFLTAAMKHLHSDIQSNAYRLLAVLALRQESALRRISSPEFSTKEAAVALFRRFLSVDPSADVKLARQLPGRGCLAQAGPLDSVQAMRALDILDETSQGRRLLPILGHLPDSADSRVSAKATLFVGRRVQNANWTARQLARPDQRIRANAVEALWGVNTPPAVRILETCMGDQNNRVAGNSMVGLHIAGREGVDREVLSMSRVGKEDVRTTAAWAMGKIALPPFYERLTELSQDEHAQVRGMALRSLLELGQSQPDTPKESGTEQQKPETADLPQCRALWSGSSIVMRG